MITEQSLDLIVEVEMLENLKADLEGKIERKQKEKQNLVDSLIQIQD